LFCFLLVFGCPGQAIPVVGQDICCADSGRPLLRSLGEIAIWIAIPSLTSFSGNGGAKFCGKGTHLSAYRIPDEHVGDAEIAVMYCQQPQDLTVD
jgi:hypothetical protein